MSDRPASSAGAWAAPRPGVARALGVVNLTIAGLLGAYALASGAMLLSMARGGGTGADLRSAAPIDILSSAMSEPALVRFGCIDLATAIPLHAAMVVSGIGLYRLRPWGATWWDRTCWAKIARLVAVWGYFLLGVAPVLASDMARKMIALILARKGVMARPASLDRFTLVYTVMFSILGAAIIVLGLIYPAASIWMLGRPGVKAALLPAKSEPDQELSPT